MYRSVGVSRRLRRRRRSVYLGPPALVLLVLLVLDQYQYIEEEMLDFRPMWQVEVPEDYKNIFGGETPRENSFIIMQISLLLEFYNITTTRNRIKQDN